MICFLFLSVIICIHNLTSSLKNLSSSVMNNPMVLSSSQKLENHLWNYLCPSDIMCTHGRFVTNKYTKQQFWCECGKCKACLQKKAAARSSRIRNEYNGKDVVYFCTLTYDRMSVPYFELEDLYNIRRTGFGDLNIYRNHFITWNANKQKYVKTYKKTILETIHLTNETIYDSSRYACKPLKEDSRRVGVCYFRDLQLFQKRFRQRVKRMCGLSGLRFFNVTEYGGKTLRPHAHFLLFAPPGYDEELHTCFVQAWPFGRRVREKESFQLVRDDPAGYVSSYVNCGDNLCPFLSDNFKSKHSSSKLFGHGRQSFSLAKVKECIDRGTLDYCLERNIQGVPTKLNFPIPKYVVNRFFPIFKGYSRLTSSQVHDYISTGLRCSVLSRYSREYDVNHLDTKIDYCDEDLRKISVRLYNSYSYCRDYFIKNGIFDDLSLSYYAELYEKAWRVYKSTCYKYFVSDNSVNAFYLYDNICLLAPERQLEVYEKIGNSCLFVIDNNAKPHYKEKTLKMASMFDKYCKQKDITNFVLSTRYRDF